MSFILEKESLLRKLIMAGFLLAMLGPWSFDLVGVPAQFPCKGLPVRLVGEYCGHPVSGFRGIIMVASSLFRILSAVVNGTIDTLLPELIALIILLFAFLPVISSIQLVRNNSSRWLQVVNLILWVLGALAASAMFAMQMTRPQVAPVVYLVWGVWLYILVAVSAIVLEVVVMKNNAKSNLDT